MVDLVLEAGGGEVVAFGDGFIPGTEVPGFYREARKRLFCLRPRRFCFPTLCFAKDGAPGITITFIDGT